MFFFLGFCGCVWLSRHTQSLYPPEQNLFFFFPKKNSLFLHGFIMSHQGIHHVWCSMWHAWPMNREKKHCKEGGRKGVYTCMYRYNFCDVVWKKKSQASTFFVYFFCFCHTSGLFMKNNGPCGQGKRERNVNATLKRMTIIVFERMD